MLAWEEPLTTAEEGEGVNPAHRKWREKFIKKLSQSGILYEKVTSQKVKASLVVEKQQKYSSSPPAASIEGGREDQDQNLLCPPQRPLECPLLLCRGAQPQGSSAGETAMVRGGVLYEGGVLLPDCSQVLNAPATNASERLLARLSLPNPLKQDVPNHPSLFYTCDFKNNKLQR